MNDEFIPELHDIGKILKDKEKNENNLIKLNSHTFLPNSKDKLGSVTWWSMFHHKVKDKIDLSKIPFDKWKETLNDFLKAKYGDGISINDIDLHNLFILILADHLAASISRTTLQRYRGLPHIEDKIRIKLWNHKMENINYENMKLSLNEVVDTINNCKCHIDFLNNYKELLHIIPEDQSAPRNTTTLYTHLELVGKIYRVLYSKTSIRDNKIVYNTNEVNGIGDAEGSKRTKGEDASKEGKIKAALAFCNISFPHSFVRKNDIYLLKLRNELVNLIKCKDNVCLAMDNYFVLFLAGSHEECINDMLSLVEEFKNKGFQIDIEYIYADLGILRSNLPRKIKDAYEGKIDGAKEVIDNLRKRGTIFKKYIISKTKDIESIQGHLCDVCQVDKGHEEWKDNVREYICNNCKEIRKQGEPLTIYGKEWDEEGVDVCWFKFSLNQDKLNEWLERKYMEYVDNKVLSKVSEAKTRNELRKVIEEEFRPLALQIDFNEDYKLMLKEFWRRIKEENDIFMPIKGYYELGVFKYSPELLKKVITTYCELFSEYFPDCVDDEECPINLSLFVESVKYPLREYWRYLDSKDNKSFLNIRSHRHVGDEAYTKEQIEKVLGILSDESIPSSFLHKLVEIHDNIGSDIFVEVEIYNNRNKYKQPYNAIASVKGLTVKKVLTLYKLLRKEVEENV
ncbi:MAG: hypothetical protein KatS3mg003_2232 [Candidatus Nitrosocaldaceae archaeon]|nr:MAG: hypothetical protein KatS3mg003_2166 [Candidatus Nitrosocaldaceae archaeon]GIU72753.1 MAG: hypothetical protein KatS3mg003_2232 [Candidatus Nitrosocaldaceae archaeon]